MVRVSLACLLNLPEMEFYGPDRLICPHYVLRSEKGKLYWIYSFKVSLSLSPSLSLSLSNHRVRIWTPSFDWNLFQRLVIWAGFYPVLSLYHTVPTINNLEIRKLLKTMWKNEKIIELFLVFKTIELFLVTIILLSSIWTGLNFVVWYRVSQWAFVRLWIQWYKSMQRGFDYW